MPDMVVVFEDGTEASFDGDRWRVDDDPELEGLLGRFFVRGNALVDDYPVYCPNERYLPAYAAIEMLGGLIETEPEIPSLEIEPPPERTDEEGEPLPTLGVKEVQ